MLLPKPRPHVFDKRDQAREKANALRSVYAQVSSRDERQCRCCGRRDGLHHHHIVWRSMGGKDTTENLTLLCKFCHALVHARQLWVISKNADKRVTFEIHEAAVVDLFGTKELPKHVRMVTESRRFA